METVNSRVAIVLYLFLLLACIYYAKSQESQCMYQYLEQPPVDIICDPYNSESTGLTLQCQVLADGPSSSYSVGWFYYPTNHTGTTPPRPLSVTSTIRDNVIAATSVVTITLTLRPLVDGSSPGFYYCQVLPDDQSETIPSDNFTLYAPEDNHYLTFVLCESMAPRYKNEVKCAVPMGQNAPRDPTEIPPNDGVPNTTTRNVSTTTTIPQSDDAFPTSEAVTNSTTVTCTENGAESDSSQNSSLMLYQIIVFVLTPVFLVILIVLIITIAVCLGRKCARWSTEQHKKAEENRTRGGQARLGGLSQLRQSFHRMMRSQPRPMISRNSTPLSSLDLQPNPSYLKNSRNTTLLQSRTYQNSPLLESQRSLQTPVPCRQDITRQEDQCSNGGSIVSYEDSSYVIMRSSGTDSTYQSSGAYESICSKL